MNNTKRRRGSVMIEFVLVGIAGMTLMVSTVQLGLVMWNYHTLAEAVHETNRFIASHGRSCAVGGNSCTITVGDIATKLKGLAVGIPDTSINMTLTSQSGVTLSCNPLSSFESNGTQWPPVADFDNSPGAYTTISANLAIQSSIISLWYGTTGQRINSVHLTSTSSIPIVF
jgi:hypothetical protein